MVEKLTGGPLTISAVDGTELIVVGTGCVDAMAAERMAREVKKMSELVKPANVVIDLSDVSRLDAHAVVTFEDLEAELADDGIAVKLLSFDEASKYLLEMIAASPTLWK